MWAATGGQAEVKTRQDKGYWRTSRGQNKTRQRLQEAKQRSRQDKTKATGGHAEVKTRQMLQEAKQRSTHDKTRQGLLEVNNMLLLQSETGNTMTAALATKGFID